jgi:hypothetical protein
MNPRQVYKVLCERQVELARRLDVVEKTWMRHQRDDPSVQDHIRALYTHSLAIMQAEQSWLTAFLDEWRTRYPAVMRDEPNVDKPDTDSDSTAPTALHRRTTPTDQAKMLQRLKRPPMPGE